MCDNLDHLNIDVVHCTDEKDLLIQWMELIKDEDPDFITGYNKSLVLILDILKIELIFLIRPKYVR